MCHVAVRHDEVVVADNGLAFAGRTAMERDALSQHAVVAHDEPCLLTAELEVLRYSTDDGGGEDVTVVAQLGITQDGGVGIYHAVVTYDDIAVDKDERTYLYVLAYLGLRMNTG